MDDISLASCMVDRRTSFVTGETAGDGFMTEFSGQPGN
jgi:hypothetical protein